MYLGELAALAAAALWAGASILFANLGAKKISPQVLNLFKCALALVLLWMTMGLMEHSWLPHPDSDSALIALAISGVIGLTLGDTAYFHALNRLGPRRTLIFATLSPPTTAVMAYAFLDEPLTKTMILGIIVTLAGVIWVIKERQPEASTTSPKDSDNHLEKFGIFFALVAIACQATGNILTKYGSQGLAPLETSVTRLAFGVVALVVWVIVGKESRKFTELFTQRGHLKTLTLATIIGTYLGIWLMVAGLQYTSNTGVAATLSSMSPVFILPLSALFLKEHVSIRAITGAVLALTGVAILIMA